MPRRRRLPGPSLAPLLVLLVAVSVVWGFERWRRAVATRAGRGEKTRVHALARCLLGRDGAALIAQPEAVRQRLRRLAMETSDTADTTWMDACVPLARALARHATEVDDTRPVTAAQSRVVERTRELAASVARLGLVWRVRSGDGDTDMDTIAERLAHAAFEIDLAGAPQSVGDTDGPVAPDVESLARFTTLAVGDLEPEPVGTPEHFFASSPRPRLTGVDHDEDAWHVTALANDASYAWRARSDGFARINTSAPDAPRATLRLFRPTAPTAFAGVPPVTNALEGARVQFDAVLAGDVLWYAGTSPWTGTVLERFVAHRTVQPIVLAPPFAPLALDRARTVVPDESVALLAHGASGAFVAYTIHTAPAAVDVILASVDARTSHVTALGRWSTVGERPALALCDQDARPPVLVVGASAAWSVLAVDADGTPARDVPPAREVLTVHAPAHAPFDEQLVVRCDPHGLVVQSPERPRASPVIDCVTGAGGVFACERVPAPATPLLSTLPSHFTRDLRGRSVLHADWPVVFVRVPGGELMARARGTVVTVARRAWGASAWDNERVVFDAAASVHGLLARGAMLYADGDEVTLAVTTRDAMHLLASHDGGRHWS